MAFTPWMTSNDLIEAVKRKIAFPVSQNTFSEEDILRFANEEMFISQVPSVLQFHEEYFVYRVVTPLVTNISRYAIPDRAIGMRLRDLMWSDSSGNFFEMTRINADDKAFFQRNIGANQAIHKFYIENNDVVLTPAVVGSPTGNLNFFIFLRPNQLVKNDRARIIQSFTQDITVANNGAFVAGDKINITLATQTPQPLPFDFVAVNKTSKVILISNAPPTTTISCVNHGLTDGDVVQFVTTSSLPSGLALNTNYYVLNAVSNSFSVETSPGSGAISITSVGSGVNSFVQAIKTITSYEDGSKIEVNAHGIPVDSYINIIISNSNSTPSINGTYQARAISATELFIDKPITSSGTSGYYEVIRGFKIEPTANDTAANLQSAISAALVNNGMTATVNNSTVTCTFDDITNSFVTLNETAVTVSSQIGFNFDANAASLMAVNSKIDFLQTKPGHKTYVFDIRVRAVNGSNVKVNRSDLLVDLATGFGFTPQIVNVQVGDYVCLAGESIIPQLPPDLHNMLAEKTAARILASLGDQAGLAMANDKIKEMEYRQGSLIDGRVDGSPQKITSRNSILRYNKMGVRKRM